MIFQRPLSMFVIGIVLILVLSVFFYLNISKIREGGKTASIVQALNKEIKTEPEHIKERQTENKAVIVSLPKKSVDYLAENKEVKALMEKLGSDDIDVSQDAAGKLAELGKSVIPSLIDVLKGASIALKGQIIFLLGRIGDKDAVPVLVEVLKDENAYIRRNAAEALGKIKNEGAIASLSTSLFDEDSAVRERSAWALGEIKDTRAVESLLDRMSDEKDEMVKTSAVNSLGKIQDQRATLVLLKELKLQTDSLYKNEVVKSLGELRDPLAIKDLTEHLEILKQYSPTEKMIIFQWQEAIKITEEAINKIQNTP